MALTKGDGSVEIYLNLEDSEFKSQLKGAQNQASGFASTVTKILGAIGIAKLAKDFAMAGIDYNIAMENYQASFETLTGSVKKATALIKELKDYGARTPFELGDLAKSTETLLSYGIANEKVIPIMKMLGDVSLGNKEKLSGLSMAYGQVQSTGKLMGQDLLQMINQGFNPLLIISQKTGKSMATLKDEMSKGAISADMVAEAFKIATSEGGMFFGGMEKKSATLSGQISTLKDNFNTFAGNAMKPLTDYAKDKFIPMLNDILGDSKKIDAILGKVKTIVTLLGVAFLATKTNMAISTVATQWKNFSGTISTFSNTFNSIKTKSVTDGLNGTKSTMVGLKGATMEATGATNGFGIAMKAMSAATAVIGIGMLIYQLGDLVGMWDAEKSKVDELIESTAKLNENHKETMETARQKADASVLELDYASKLNDELKNMVDSNGKVKEGYEDRAKFIVNELKEATGLEIKMTDGVIENYQQISEEIKETIKQQKAKAIVDSYAEVFAKTLKNEAEALKLNKEAHQELNNMLENKSKIIDDYAKTMVNSYTNEAQAQKNATDLYEKELKKQEQLAKDNADNLIGIQSDRMAYENMQTDLLIGNYDKINAMAKSDLKAYSSNLEERKKALKDGIDEEVASLQALELKKGTMDAEKYEREKKSQEQSLELKRLEMFALNNIVWANSPQYSEAYAYLSEQGASAFDENGDLTKPAQAHIDELTAQALGVSMPDYKRVMSELAKKGVEVFGQDGKLTVEAQNIISSLTTTIDGDNRPKEAYSRLGFGAKKAYKDSADLYQAGSDTVAGLAKGVNENGGGAISSMKNLASNMITAYKKTMNQHSPSRIMTTAGSDTIQGVINGVALKAGVVVDDMETLANDMTSAFIDNVALEIQDVDVPTFKLAYELTNIDENPMQDLKTGFENQVSNSLNVKANQPVQNIINYNIEQNIQNVGDTSPSQLARETENLIKRAEWSV